jgi:DNA polymerase III subunit beta
MKFTCVKDNLREAIFLGERLVGKKLALPILNAILFTAERGKITLTTTNLETGIEVWINAKIEKEGRVAIPARIISSYISSLRDEQVSFSLEGDTLVVTSGGTKTHIKTFPPDEFPLLPKVSNGELVTFPSDQVKNALSHVVMSAAVSEIKPELASILFKFDATTCKITATDSFRLAEKKISLPKVPTNTPYFLLPVRTALEIIKLLEGDEKEVNMNVAKNQIMITTGKFLLVSRLTEGVFPEYEKIIPSKFATEVRMKREDMLDILKVAGLFVGKLQDVTLEVDATKNTIQASTSNSEIGENTSKVTADVSGEPLRVSFNYRYLMDGISHLDSLDIIFAFASASGPLVMRNTNDTSYLYIAMPMKV